MMTLKAQPYGFEYLFYCNPLMPTHQFYAANISLMVAFFKGTLNTHCYRFNHLIDKWIVNLPKFERPDPRAVEFYGCLRMERAYDTYIVKYFQLKQTTAHKYLDHRIRTLDVR